MADTDASYRGTHAVTIYTMFDSLKITAAESATWIIEIRPWASMRTVDLDTPGTISGSDDEVFLFTGTGTASLQFAFAEEGVYSLISTWEEERIMGNVVHHSSSTGSGTQASLEVSPGVITELHCTGSWALTIEP